MESYFEVKALAALTAIPVVALALWADYFSRAIDELAKEDPHYDRTTEHYKVRLAGIGALFLQFGIFVGTAPLRTEAPLFGTFSFIAAVIIQATIQARTDLKLRPQVTPQPGVSFDSAARAFVWATVGGFAYLVVLFASISVFSVIARFSHVSQLTSNLLVIAGSIVGVAGGIAVNFALGAFHLRKILPVKEFEDTRLKSILEACFAQAGVPAPSLWLVEAERFREATAMIAGFRSGRGIFRPGLFISRRMVDELNADELRAVVLHEVSHLKLNHLRKRLMFSIALIVGSTAAATFCLFLASALVPDGDFKNYVGVATAAGAFMFTFNLLGRQSRLHEIEADLYAVSNLSAGHEELISSLRKIDRINQQNTTLLPEKSVPKNFTHPSTEIRIALLHARFGQMQPAQAEEKRVA